MKKTILIILACLIVLSGAGIVYLNNVVLPSTAKSFIIKAIEGSTQKKASLSSVKINIFKGIVLRDLIIYDQEEEIVSIKEVSCIFWFWGLTHKKIVIPSVILDSARLSLERRNDNSFNLTELFLAKKDNPIGLKPGVPPATKDYKERPSSGFTFEVYKIKAVDSEINFKDSSFAEPFTQDLNNVDIVIYLSFPDSLKFKAYAQLQGNLKPNIYLNGEFKLPQQELKANILVKNIKPGEFNVYLQPAGVILGGGVVDASVSLSLKDNIMDFDCQASAAKMDLGNDKVSAKFNSQVNANIKYLIEEGRAEYSGNSLFSDTVLSATDFAALVNIEKATVYFDNEGLACDDILARLWGLPINARIKLVNFNDPQFNIGLFSDFDLALARDLLKSKFNLAVPFKVKGKARLSLDISADSLNTKPIKLGGYLDILGASLKPDNMDASVEDIEGRLEFSSDQARAKDLLFKYQSVPCKLSFLLNDFKSPRVTLEAASEEILVKSDFNVNKTIIQINSLSGRYLNSELQVLGSFNTSSSEADISGALAINLEDLNKPFARFKDQLDKINPKGKAQVKFSLKGDTRDIKGCAIEARLVSPQVILYGLKPEKISGYYRQQYGVGEVPFLDFSFYSGEIKFSARVNLKSDNLPYALNLSLRGVKIEEVKLDTPASKKDISGIIDAEVKINGFSSDLSKITGVGSVDIIKGKLWELDLFKGMGKLLFVKDFAYIIFHEGSCDFSVQDKNIFTNNLMLKSNMANLSGKVSIGFDSSLEASLNVDIIDKLVPLTGTFKDVTTAVIGSSGKFATINITGTLKEPKYKFRPVVENIIKGLTDTLKQVIRGHQDLN
jgi:hypothetical protein